MVPSVLQWSMLLLSTHWKPCFSANRSENLNVRVARSTCEPMFVSCIGCQIMVYICHQSYVLCKERSGISLLNGALTLWTVQYNDVWGMDSTMSSFHWGYSRDRAPSSSPSTTELVSSERWTSPCVLVVCKLSTSTLCSDGESKFNDNCAGFSSVYFCTSWSLLQTINS